MKFKGRNGGTAVALRNHIVMMRCFAVSLLLFLIPTIVFLCLQNSYFYVFLIMPAMFLILSFAVLLEIKSAETKFLAGQKKDHIFEVINDCIYKDNREIKLKRSIKIYQYRRFWYMETSHSMFIIKDSDYIVGSRDELIAWARANEIRVLYGY